MKKIILLCVLLGVISSCKTSKSSKFSEAEMQNLENLLVDSSWEMECNWASPMATVGFAAVANSGLLPPGNTANMINLIGNPNYLKKKEDTIAVYLPYFGERRMGGNYGGRGTAIESKSIPKIYEITKNEKKQRFDIHLEINDVENTTELYVIDIRVFPNKNCLINVNSTQRTNINYSGTVRKLKLE